MKTEQPVNRVLEARATWDKKEKDFEKIFGRRIHDNGSFLRDKISFFEDLTSKYSKHGSEDERLAIKILQEEKRELINKAFPRDIDRLFYSINKLFNSRRQAGQARKTIAENYAALEKLLTELGFGHVKEHARQQLYASSAAFTIPAVIDGPYNTRTAYELSFVANNQGVTELDGYKATLFNGNEQTFHTFNMKDLPATAEQARNLLEGRSVFCRPLHSTSDAEGVWHRLDLNDKLVSGNYATKTYMAGNNYDLRAMLDKLQIKEQWSLLELSKLHSSLLNGNRVSVTAENDGGEKRIYIEANPQANGFTFYNDRFKKISMAEALNDRAFKKLTNNMEPVSNATRIQNQGKLTVR